MIFVFNVLFAIIIILFYQPYIKLYQLNGYDFLKTVKNIFCYKYSFGGKNKLKLTKRLTRFEIVFYGFIFGLECFVLLLNGLQILWLYLTLIVLSPVVFFISHLLICPIEKFIKKYYINKAKRKLKLFNGIKIAITGSFGKTSVKKILKNLLDDYRVVETPLNYNTPMGVCKTILSDLKSDIQIMIFEMGARKIGDIKELMKIINPDIGIMTAIGEQHLETFKSLDTILKTKNELVDNFKSSGKIYFDGKNNNTKKLYRRCKKRKFLACDEKGKSFYRNVKYTKNGMAFDMFIDGKSVRVKTKLLGEINCENIVLASTVAYYLGISIEDLKNKIELLKPIQNRLELKQMKDFTIIDDSYNANEIGVKESAEILKNFRGRKIVVTSGLVECGMEQFKKNYNIGKIFSGVADKIIIMNEINKKAIYTGLIENNFNKNNIYFAKNREEERILIKNNITKNCVVLFQNDLPDNYK